MSPGLPMIGSGEPVSAAVADAERATAAIGRSIDAGDAASESAHAVDDSALAPSPAPGPDSLAEPVQEPTGIMPPALKVRPYAAALPLVAPAGRDWVASGLDSRSARRSGWSVMRVPAWGAWCGARHWLSFAVALLAVVLSGALLARITVTLWQRAEP